jgi:cytochrome c peroxidase
MLRHRIIIAVAALTVLAGAAVVAAAMRPGKADTPSLEDLGRTLFSDVNFSLNRTQACATCHVPDLAFTDLRETPAGRAASLGDDGHSIGDRNTPTATYAAFSPPFHRREDGAYIGGQFLDGRSARLEDQAGQPPLNPLEMGMPDKASIIGRLKENPDYVRHFKALFKDDVFASDDTALNAMTTAIAAFERTPEFSPFDSKYDRSLRSEYKLTPQEELGRVLFFSKQFTNCNLCHMFKSSGGQEQETFSNYTFHNIGVPANPSLNTANGRGRIDKGLAENPQVPQPGPEAGKFKVPTLRNVAVTAPYMHNGVFKDLRTTILFYNKYNSIALRRQIDPETGAAWAPPEVGENIALKELETGPALEDKRVDALIAFLKTLTDRRYENLIPEKP